jgi:hypothetical protein
MNTHTPEQLQEVLTLHRAWLNGAAEGRGADLRGADLRGAVLSGADLSYADLSGADLSYADLSGADLSGAVLRGADLSGADLSYADLRGADLRGAVLSGAVLSGADLSGAVLRGAVLSGADLSYADLRGADLRGAVLSGAVLSDSFGLSIAADAPARLLAVARAALASPDALEMGSWHKCDTTHCICGWAEHLGGPLAELIIRTQGNDAGGLMLLGVEAHAHFYKTNEEARAFLQSVIDQAEVAK